MITPNQRVDKVFHSGALSEAFGFATDIGTAPEIKYFFSEIYAPIKKPTAQGMPEDWEFVNIGVTPLDLAQIYRTYYSAFYLIRAKSLDLFPFMRGVFIKNKYKYQRLIELQGYTFNPLWNVDADERYSHIDTHGDKETTNVHKVDETTSHTVNQDVTNYSRSYEGATPADGAYDTKTNTSATDTNQRHNTTETEEDNQDKITEKHNSIKNGQDEITIDDEINPLEFNVPQVDELHVERHIRRGNIGVTKSTELLEDAINYVRNNVITEFFNDLNEVILIEVTDY